MDLEVAFPESSSFSRITEEMCDYNGHMNVLFYFKLFIENLENYYEDDLGFSKEYFKQEIRTPIHLSIGQEFVASSICNFSYCCNSMSLYQVDVL